MVSEQSVQTLIAKLAATREEILQTVEGLDEKALTWQPGDGRWSIKETLAHLASAEGSHRQVAQDIAAGQTVDVPDFDL
ncbi:MAG: DinB family protein, partial [Anaerolineae bacterium]